MQGVLLTLNLFEVEHYGAGPTTAEPCGATPAGRGCLHRTGGLIQATRVPVATTGGTGYAKRYAYDQCVSQAPPPHFPTTGRFFGGRNYYEVNPAGFDVTGFFRAHTPP